MLGAIWFDTRISTDSPNAHAIAKLTGEADTTNLYFSYEGNLPGEPVIRVQLEKYTGNNNKLLIGIVFIAATLMGSIIIAKRNFSKK